jgi:hypothetical protein
MFQLAMLDALSLASALRDQKDELSAKSLTELGTEVNMRKVKCTDILVTIFDSFVEAELFDPSLVAFSMKFNSLGALTELEDTGDLNQHSFDAFVSFRREHGRHMREQLGIETMLSAGDAFNEADDHTGF